MAEAVGVNDMRQATPKGLVSEKEYLPTKLVDNCVCRKGPVGLASSAMKSQGCNRLELSQNTAFQPYNSQILVCGTTYYSSNWMSYVRTSL